MAKEGSESAAEEPERQEVVGEHRRTVARPRFGLVAGTGHPDQAAPAATDDSDRRFDDLYNLVCDPAFLVHAWERVRGNRGARTAGVDGQTAFYVTKVRGVEGFLDDLRPI